MRMKVQLRKRISWIRRGDFAIINVGFMFRLIHSYQPYEWKVQHSHKITSSWVGSRYSFSQQNFHSQWIIYWWYSMSERQIEKYRMFEKMYGTFTRTDSVTINEGEIIPRFRRWFFKRKKKWGLCGSFDDSIRKLRFDVTSVINW